MCFLWRRATGGTLEELRATVLRQATPELREHACKILFHQLASTIQCLHREGIMHRDLHVSEESVCVCALLLLLFCCCLLGLFQFSLFSVQRLYAAHGDDVS